MAAKLSRRDQEACLKGAKAIYLSSTRQEARSRFEEWAYQWRLSQPKAVKCLEADLEELLSFLDCPPAHWRKVRTTNAIERAFREVRRRTRPMSGVLSLPMGCFNNPASVDRIIYGIVSHLNHTRKDNPLPEFTHNT